MKKGCLIAVGLFVALGVVVAILDPELPDQEREQRPTPAAKKRENTSVAEMDSLAKMKVAFVGGRTREQIQRQMDRAMRLYGLPTTEENYSRAGSVLVTMRS